MLLEHQKALIALQEQLKRLEQLLSGMPSETLTKNSSALPSNTTPNPL